MQGEVPESRQRSQIPAPYPGTAAARRDPRLLLQPVARLPVYAPAVCPEDLCNALPWARVERPTPAPPNLIPKLPPGVLTAALKARALGLHRVRCRGFCGILRRSSRERRRLGRRRWLGRAVRPCGCHVSCRRWSRGSWRPALPGPWALGNALDPVSAVLMAPVPLLPALSEVP